MPTVPEYLDLPCDGVITQGFGAGHGGIDIADTKPVPVYAAAAGYAERHVPGDGFGDGSFGNHVVIDHGDGWYSLVAHLEAFALDGDGSVAAGQRLGIMGYTGYTVPSGPDGRHVHWAMCRRKLFPRFPGNEGLFADPRDYLAGEAERMALFQRLEQLEVMVAGGEPRIAAWVSGGNISLVDCLGPQPARVAEMVAAWDGIQAQTYGTNDLLHRWRAALAAAGIVVP